MTVSYTKTQREIARRHGLALITVSVPGFDFQGPATPEEAASLQEWLTAFFERRNAKVEQRTEETKTNG